MLFRSDSVIVKVMVDRSEKPKVERGAAMDGELSFFLCESSVFSVSSQ